MNTFSMGVTAFQVIGLTYSFCMKDLRIVRLLVFILTLQGFLLIFSDHFHY